MECSISTRVMQNLHVAVVEYVAYLGVVEPDIFGVGNQFLLRHLKLCRIAPLGKCIEHAGSLGLELLRLALLRLGGLLLLDLAQPLHFSLNSAKAFLELLALDDVLLRILDLQLLPGDVLEFM